MKLIDLDAAFLKIIEVEPNHVYRTEGISLAEAQGIIFLCPKCFAENRGKVGTHSVICWFKDRGVPDDFRPNPGRWIPSGTGLDDLTFTGPGAASVLLTGGCGWHGFVTNGEAA